MIKLITIGVFTYFADEQGKLFGSCCLAEKFFFEADAGMISEEIMSKRLRLSKKEKDMLAEYNILT